MSTIYQNNDVSIEMEIHSSCEAKINVNGENLIWISRDSADDFCRDLKKLLDEHKI